MTEQERTDALEWLRFMAEKYKHAPEGKHATILLQIASKSETSASFAIQWQTPEDADKLLRPLLDESGAVDECVVKLDRDIEGFDGGPDLREAWYDGARGHFVCSSTARTLYEVTAWAYGKEASGE